LRTEGLREAKRGVKAAKEHMQAAASKALNRVGQGVMTEASRKVRETYNIKAADVKDALRIVLSPSGAGEVEIKAKGRNLPLTHFKLTPKQPNPKRPKTVKVAVRRGDTKKIGPAYLLLGSSRLRVMKRQKPTGQGKPRVLNAKGHRPELPIEELFGPAVPVLLNEPQVIRHIEQQAEERMEKRLDHEINRILR